MEIRIAGFPVRGAAIDERTGCAHYRSAFDIVAIKFACCQSYFACFYCHEVEAGHRTSVWNRDEFDKEAVLCGVCGTELTIHQYLECGARCPRCRSGFNPRCELHHHLYFDTE